jgi:hypothetical protein
MDSTTKRYLEGITKKHTAEYNNIVNTIEYCEALQIKMNNDPLSSFYCRDIIIHLYTALELIQIVAGYTLSEFIIEAKIQKNNADARRYIKNNSGTSEMYAFHKAEKMLRSINIIEFDNSDEENEYRKFRSLRNNIHPDKVCEDINTIYNKTFQLSTNKYFDLIANYIKPVSYNLNLYIEANSKNMKGKNK